MTKCSWKGCESEGIHKVTDREGIQWALLCDEHNEELNASIREGSAPKIMSCYVKAKGGAEKAAKELSADILCSMKVQPLFRKMFDKEEEKA